ncbi:MAG TPA: hypothetical protein VJH04_02805 [archaeon]|nr:hypothetical protein [archaeon]
MKKGRIKKTKFAPLDIKPSEKCYLCKKKAKLCKCIDCKFCGTLLKKNEFCKYCKGKNKVILIITNAELNALEDLSLVDLKAMLKENREKEVEVWQNRCKAVWHRLVRKIDKA